MAIHETKFTNHRKKVVTINLITMKLNRAISYLLILAMGSAIAFSSCSTDPDAMQLPPAESIVIDWDLFPSQGTTKGLQGDPLTSVNFVYSAGNVLVWSALAAVTTVVPTAAYLAALKDVTPVYQGDNTWHWNYSVPIGFKTYVARLEGSRIDNETFSMEMYLTVAGEFEDFLWFDGIIRYDGTQATWTLNNGPALGGGDLLEIKYDRNFDDDIYTTRYTVKDPANDLYEDYIDFGIDATATDFDAHFDISLSDTVIMIQWDSELGMGQVKSSKTSYGTAGTAS